jgi:polyadenylation factor subunit 2
MASTLPLAGPSRHPRGADSWHPTAYLERPHPDTEEVVEQAAYQAAVTKHHGERKTRYKPRKTVDYQGGVIKWRQTMRIKSQASKASGIGVEGIHPTPSDLVGVSTLLTLSLAQGKGL